MALNNSDIMTCHEQKLREMLAIGQYLGSGLRYLLYYYGQLAITNEMGLMRWPEGPKVVVAAIKAQECVSGLGPVREEYLVVKLRSLEAVMERQSRRANEENRRHDYFEARP